MRSDHPGEQFPYEAIYAAIWARIRRGEYPPGGKLPSLQDFVAEFERDIGTVRRAMARLQADGYVVIRPGLGTFVARALPPPR